MNSFDSYRWLEYVKKHKINLQKEIAYVRQDWPEMRNLMAEGGVEMTPQELEELTVLVEETLEIIKNEEWKNDN